MPYLFKVLEDETDQARYSLSLISRKLATLENLEGVLRDFAGYSGTHATAEARLIEAADLIGPVQDKILAAMAAQIDAV